MREKEYSMEMIKVSDLKPHPRNEEFFDSISGTKWEEFIKSVKERGVIEPVVITSDNVIVSGHHRVKACSELGIEEVKCVIRTYDNEDDVIRDLIETNIRQRGDVGGSEMKMAARVKELERIYEIQHGGDRKSNPNNSDLKKTQADLASESGISVDTWNNYKKLADAIPELATAIDTGKVTKTTAISIMRRLPESEQKELLSEFSGAEKITNSDVNKYIELLEESRKEADAANKRAKELEEQLRNAESKTVEVERIVEKTVDVFPDDYESMKEELERLREEYSEMKEGKDEAERLQNLFSDDLSRTSEREIEALERIKELEELLKANDLITLTVKEMEGFTAAIYDFISRFGGKVWTFERMDKVPDDVSRNFVSAINALSAMSQQLIENLGNYPVPQ